MPATTQLNTRIDPELKRQGDVVFAREGLSSSDVVRAVWAYAARTQEVPPCIVQDAEGEVQRRLRAAQKGAGLASRVASQMGLTRVSPDEHTGYEDLRDEMYDELLDRIEARHV